MAEPFSKSDKDWSKALRVFVRDEDDPENLRTYAQYSRKDRTIELNPKFLKDPDQDALSHEISHYNLGHGVSEDDLEDEEFSKRYLKSRFRGVEKEVFELKGIIPILADLVEHLDEFEARLYQKGQGYHIGKIESFQDHLKYVLGQEKNLLTRGTILQTANQAISNMQKKGHITVKQAKGFRRQVDSVAKSFGTSSR